MTTVAATVPAQSPTDQPGPGAPRTFTTIGVIGLGTMGAGIVEVFARHGYRVIGVEVDAEGVARGRQFLEHSTDRAVRRGKLAEAEQASLLDRVDWATSLAALAEADLVIEAVVESLAVKKSIFRELETVVSPTRCWPPTPRRCRSPRSRPPTPTRVE